MDKTFVQLDVRNWDNTELVESLYEICETSKEYENDVVEVHQVVDLGKLKNEWRYLIILNISQDLDNLGAQIDHY
ncbi:hypothetical protein CN689_01110 [Peribacillus butanolivorans]|uniref:Uncharacterized protein n=2 Tax=Peribacillus butanolivorans TaxID=421767 RepID=A0AAX0S9X3_9BACI|nr:hypothetical protein CN689_01110 [Peribacillus butanolivorans]